MSKRKGTESTAPPGSRKTTSKRTKTAVNNNNLPSTRKRKRGDSDSDDEGDAQHSRRGGLKSSSDGEEEENNGIDPDEELAAYLLAKDAGDGNFSPENNGGDASEDEGDNDSSGDGNGKYSSTAEVHQANKIIARRRERQERRERRGQEESSDDGGTYSSDDDNDSSGGLSPFENYEGEEEEDDKSMMSMMTPHAAEQSSDSDEDDEIHNNNKVTAKKKSAPAKKKNGTGKKTPPTATASSGLSIRAIATEFGKKGFKVDNKVLKKEDKQKIVTDLVKYIVNESLDENSLDLQESIERQLAEVFDGWVNPSWWGIGEELLAALYNMMNKNKTGFKGVNVSGDFADKVCKLGQLFHTDRCTDEDCDICDSTLPEKSTWSGIVSTIRWMFVRYYFCLAILTILMITYLEQSPREESATALGLF